MSWTKTQPFSFKLLIVFLFQGTFIREKQLLKEVRKIKQKNFGMKESVKRDQLKIEENVKQPQYIAMFHFSVSLYNFCFPHSFQHFLIPCNFPFVYSAQPYFFFFYFDCLSSFLLLLLLILQKNCFCTYPQGSFKKLKRTKSKTKKDKKHK